MELKKQKRCLKRKREQAQKIFQKEQLNSLIARMVLVLLNQMMVGKIFLFRGACWIGLIYLIWSQDNGCEYRHAWDRKARSPSALR